MRSSRWLSCTLASCTPLALATGRLALGLTRRALEPAAAGGTLRKSDAS